MNKTKIYFAFLIFFLPFNVVYSQRNLKLNDRDSIKHWEVGFDLLWLIDKNTVPAKSVFLRYNFENSRGAKRALRVRIGGDYRSFDSFIPIIEQNDEIDLASAYLRIGYEWQREVTSNTGFFYALDVSSRYLKMKTETIDPLDSYRLSISDKTWEFGTIGIIGFTYNPTPYLSISVESSLNLILSIKKVDEVGSYNNSDPQGISGYWGRDINKITSNFSPISVLNFSFKF